MHFRREWRFVTFPEGWACLMNKFNNFKFMLIFTYSFPLCTLSQMHLKWICLLSTLNHHSSQVCELFLQYDLWFCCMEVKGSAINPLYENQKTFSCAIGYWFWPQEPFFLRNGSNNSEDSGSCASSRSDCRWVIRQWMQQGNHDHV